MYYNLLLLVVVKQQKWMHCEFKGITILTWITSDLIYLTIDNRVVDIYEKIDE